jgi:hypothetical protein
MQRLLDHDTNFSLQGGAMKRFVLCVILLSGLCLMVTAGCLQGQTPGGTNGDVHITVKGRPWETDENSLALPLGSVPGRGSMEKPVERIEDFIHQTPPILSSAGNHLPEDLRRAFPQWFRLEVIYFHLFCR